MVYTCILSLESCVPSFIWICGTGYEVTLKFCDNVDADADDAAKTITITLLKTDKLKNIWYGTVSLAMCP